MGSRKNDKHQLFTRTYTNQTTSWLMCSLSTFGAQTHKIHHGLNLGEATTFPFIVYFMLGHWASTQMAFCLGTPK